MPIRFKQAIGHVAIAFGGHFPEITVNENV